MLAFADVLLGCRTLAQFELRTSVNLPSAFYKRLAEALPRSTITSISLPWGDCHPHETAILWHNAIRNSRVRTWDGPRPQLSVEWRAFQHEFGEWNERDHWLYPAAIRRVIYAVLMVTRAKAPRADLALAGQTLHRMPVELCWLLFVWIARLNYFE